MSAELRELAERVAREAGTQLLEAFAGPAIAVEAKSTPTDLVSAADQAAEDLIRTRLAAARPDDGFLGEEGTSDRPTQCGKPLAKFHVPSTGSAAHVRPL